MNNKLLSIYECPFYIFINIKSKINVLVLLISSIIIIASYNYAFLPSTDTTFTFNWMQKLKDCMHKILNFYAIIYFHKIGIQEEVFHIKITVLLLKS